LHTGTFPWRPQGNSAVYRFMVHAGQLCRSRGPPRCDNHPGVGQACDVPLVLIWRYAASSLLSEIGTTRGAWLPLCERSNGPQRSNDDALSSDDAPPNDEVRSNELRDVCGDIVDVDECDSSYDRPIRRQSTPAITTIPARDFCSR
jgi:hypothetical protein